MFVKDRNLDRKENFLKNEVPKENRKKAIFFHVKTFIEKCFKWQQCDSNPQQLSLWKYTTYSQNIHTTYSDTQTGRQTDRHTVKKETPVFILFCRCLVNQKTERNGKIPSYMLENHVDAIGYKWLFNIQKMSFWNCKVAKCILLSYLY